MDALYIRIKQYVLKFNNTLTDDELLLLVVKSVVSRVLAYTNRQRLVYDYEQALDSGIDVTDPTNKIGLPIPVELELPIAEAVTSAYRTMAQRNEAVVGAVKSVSDREQSVTFSEGVLSYFATEKDLKVFGGIVELLDQYKLVKVNDNTVNSYEPKQPIGVRIS